MSMSAHTQQIRVTKVLYTRFYFDKFEIFVNYDTIKNEFLD